jgi:Sigma-70 region 2
MTTPSGPEPGRPDPGLRATISERRQLLNLAYRLLGSLAEAEDAVQETYARWYAMPPQQQHAIASPGAHRPPGRHRQGLQTRLASRRHRRPHRPARPPRHRHRRRRRPGQRPAAPHPRRRADRPLPGRPGRQGTQQPDLPGAHGQRPARPGRPTRRHHHHGVRLPHHRPPDHPHLGNPQPPETPSLDHRLTRLCPPSHPPPAADACRRTRRSRSPGR